MLHDNWWILIRFERASFYPHVVSFYFNIADLPFDLLYQKLIIFKWNTKKSVPFQPKTLVYWIILTPLSPEVHMKAEIWSKMAMGNS